MREMKFRAWDMDANLMHYDFQWIKLNTQQDTWMIFMSDLQPVNLDTEAICSPDRFKIMEWTGLVDSSGQSIYEGDLVYHPDWEGGVEQRVTISGGCVRLNHMRVSSYELKRSTVYGHIYSQSGEEDKI